MIKPEGLYAAETSDLTSRELLERLGKKERNILRKILEPMWWTESKQPIARKRKQTSKETERIVKSTRKRWVQLQKFPWVKPRKAYTKDPEPLWREKTVPRWLTKSVYKLKKYASQTGRYPGKKLFKWIMLDFRGFQEEMKRTSKRDLLGMKDETDRMKQDWQNIKFSVGTKRTWKQYTYVITSQSIVAHIE